MPGRLSIRLLNLWSSCQATLEVIFCCCKNLWWQHWQLVLIAKILNLAITFLKSFCLEILFLSPKHLENDTHESELKRVNILMWWCHSHTILYLCWFLDELSRSVRFLLVFFLTTGNTVIPLIRCGNYYSLARICRSATWS